MPYLADLLRKITYVTFHTLPNRYFSKRGVFKVQFCIFKKARFLSREAAHKESAKRAGKFALCAASLMELCCDEKNNK